MKTRTTISLLTIYTLIILCSCRVETAASVSANIVQIGETSFHIPADFHEWKYAKLESELPNGSISYDQLSFVVDIETFENIKPNYRKENLRDLHIEIRPVRTELGEIKYWTAEDPITQTSPTGCRDHKIDGREFEFCEHGSDVRLTSFAHDNYSIRAHGAEEYVAIIGCMNKEKFASSNLSAICVGRAIFPQDVHVEYGYKIQHLDNSVEIYSKIAKLISDMY